jgi:hypothetical protein
MRVVAVLATAIASAACLESPPGVGPDAAECLPALDDDFDDDGLDTAVWVPAAPPEEGLLAAGAGALILDANPEVADYGYIAVSSIERWPLAGLTVTADITGVEWEGNGDVGLVVTSDSGYVGVYADSGLLGAAADFGAFDLLCVRDTCSTVYSLVAHRFWRVREAAGELHFEASDGGASWLELAPPYPAPGGQLGVLLWSECGPPNRVRLVVERLTVTACGS